MVVRSICRFFLRFFKAVTRELRRVDSLRVRERRSVNSEVKGKRKGRDKEDGRRARVLETGKGGLGGGLRGNTHTTLTKPQEIHILSDDESGTWALVGP